MKSRSRLRRILWKFLSLFRENFYICSPHNWADSKFVQLETFIWHQHERYFQFSYKVELSGKKWYDRFRYRTVDYFIMMQFLYFRDFTNMRYKWKENKKFFLYPPCKITLDICFVWMHNINLYRSLRW